MLSTYRLSAVTLYYPQFSLSGAYWAVQFPESEHLYRSFASGNLSDEFMIRKQDKMPHTHTHTDTNIDALGEIRTIICQETYLKRSAVTFTLADL